MQQPEPHPHVVYRQLAIPVAAFDHLKDTQRARQVALGRPLTLNDTVALILGEHRTLTQNVASEERNHERAPRTPAVCR